MDGTPVKCEDAQALLLAQRRLVQAEDEKRFLRRRMRALEKELAAGRPRSGFAQGETGERYIAREANVHESLFWWLDLDTHFTRITQVLSSEQAILGELQDQCKQDHGALEELGPQVSKLHQTVNGLNGVLGLLRCAVEEAFGREPSIGAEEDSGVRSENPKRIHQKNGFSQRSGRCCQDSDREENTAGCPPEAIYSFASSCLVAGWGSSSAGFEAHNDMCSKPIKASAKYRQFLESPSDRKSMIVSSLSFAGSTCPIRELSLTGQLI
ncbi:hypothetical protein B0H13DRAFT_1916295 [Mycena leptocephala]|nr:hypothetical protein B0H13DRAFT_1916295 [Mycena leptocephala]